LDVYVKWLRLRSEHFEMRQTESEYLPWESHSWLVFISCSEMLVYVLGVFIALFVCKHIQHVAIKPHSWKQVVSALILSSFGRLFVILMIVWDYHQNFGRLVDLMVLTSHTTALMVLLELSSSQAATIVVIAFLLRALFSLCI